MSISMSDHYYLKALDNYPWNFEFALESLDYALSSDPDHAQANCLMGRICMNELKDFEKAAEYFELALVSNLNYIETYKYFSLLKIWLGEYEAAFKMIDYAMKIRGMDRSVMLRRRAFAYECLGQFRAAKIQLKMALRMTHCVEHQGHIESELSRLKKKSKLGTVKNIK